MVAEPLRAARAVGLRGWALLAVLWLMPWPLASNRVWVVGLLLAPVTALALWQLWLPRSRRGEVLGLPRGMRLHMALMAAWVAWIALQLLPLPGALRAVLEHSRVAGYPLPRAGWAPLSVDPWATQAYLVKAVLLLLLQWLLLRVFDNRLRVETLIRAWLVLGAAQAFAAVVLFAAGESYTLFFVHVYQGLHAKGSFVYHNHFAAYMELMLALGIGWMIALLGRRAPPGRHAGALQWVFVTARFLASGKALLRILLIVLVIGLIASRSRMGNAAFFVALWVVGGATLLALRRVAGGRAAARAIGVLMLSILVLDVVIIGGVVGIDKVVARIESTHLGASTASAPARAVDSRSAPDDAAVEAQQDTVAQRVGPGLHALRMLADFPLAGTGGGSFEVAFFPYRPAEVLGFYDHAHDDYVEFAVESGVIGAALLLALVGWSQWRAWRLLLAVDSDAFERGMAFASAMGALEILIHATVDFNLQNPTNAVLFLWLLSLPHWVEARKFRHIATHSSKQGAFGPRISPPEIGSNNARGFR